MADADEVGTDEGTEDPWERPIGLWMERYFAGFEGERAPAAASTGQILDGAFSIRPKDQTREMADRVRACLRETQGYKLVRVGAWQVWVVDA